MRNGSGIAARPILRLLLAAFGFGGAAWGVWMFPGFVRGATIETVASRIIMTEPYRLEPLKTVLAFNEVVVPSGLCRPSNARAAAILQIKAVETVMETGSGEEIDQEQRELSDGLARALACAPADPYLMLAMFWQRNMTTGFDAASLAFLNMSYKLGPNEAWVGFRRNRLAVALLPDVPPETAEKILTEFARLVQSHLYMETIDIYRSADTETRKKLLAKLSIIDEVSRRAFMSYLRSYDLDPPDMRPPDSELRPWQRR